MYNIGEVAEIIATEEEIKTIGADCQLYPGQNVKILGKFPDGWLEVEGSFFEMPCSADIPHYFLKKK